MHFIYHPSLVINRFRSKVVTKQIFVHPYLYSTNRTVSRLRTSLVTSAKLREQIKDLYTGGPKVGTSLVTGTSRYISRYNSPSRYRSTISTCNTILTSIRTNQRFVCEQSSAYKSLICTYSIWFGLGVRPSTPKPNQIPPNGISAWRREATREVFVSGRAFQAKRNAFPSKNILQIVNKIERSIEKKKLVSSSNNILLMISGGQDSIFLLFCFSFLQSQTSFKAKMIWCNHFWQISSFYTTLHLTKSSVAFSYSIICFLPFSVNASLPSFPSCKKKDVRLAFSERGRSTACRFAYKTFYRSSCVQPLHVMLVPMQIEDLQSESSRVSSLYLPFRLVTTPSYKYNSLSRYLSSPYKSKSQICKKICKAKGAWTLLTNHRFVRRREGVVRGLHGGSIVIRCLLNFGERSGCTGMRYVSLYKKFVFCSSQKGAKYKTWFSTKRSKPSLRRKAWHCYMEQLLQKLHKKPKGKGYKSFVEEISETRARAWRHITTERASTFYNSDRCIYGHTASDRIETLLFNLIRGMREIGSLSWKRSYSTFCYNNFYPFSESFTANTHIDKS